MCINFITPGPVSLSIHYILEESRKEWETHMLHRPPSVAFEELQTSWGLYQMHVLIYI